MLDFKLIESGVETLVVTAIRRLDSEAEDDDYYFLEI